MDFIDNGLCVGKRKLTDSRVSETTKTHSKRRSHSRGNSITNFDDILGLPTNPTSAIPSPPRSRPTSHHRRRSSVSTRRESAEVMGLSVPDDAAKESITSSRVDSHLRALFALEGRTSPGSSPLATTSFGIGLATKVDLPDFGAETDKPSDSTAAFAPSSSSSAKPLSTSFSTNNSLAGKRDSFGKLLAPVAVGAKKELQTLLEEDEGDDSDSEAGCVPVPATRHRPRSLNLRSSLILRAQSASTLPTPSPTPSTARTPKLKSLTLAASSNALQLSAPKRSSTLVISNSVPLLSAAELEMTQRQGSISYRKPNYLNQQHSISDATLSSLFLGLPPTMNNIGGSSTSSSPAHSPRSKTLTPTMSPVIGRRSVSGSGSSSGTSTGSPTPSSQSRRSKSPTELLVTQSSYLAQSHASLLARISELEVALGRATAASPALTTSEPSEELLEMLSDLKAERDQLKRSLDVLTERFGELEKTLTSLGRKLDNEKREAWVSKEKLRVKEDEMNVLVNEKEVLQEEVEELRNLLGNARAAAREEKDKRLEVERELHVALETNRVAAVPYPYPTHYGRGPRGSLDSQLTTSEVGGFSMQASRRDVHTVTENDEDTSSHSRSPSSASFSSGPMTHQARDVIPSGWSFAKAAMRAKERTRPTIDPLLDDEDETEYVNKATTSSAKLSPPVLKHGSPLTPSRIISSPGPFTSSSGVSSSGASGVLSSPGAYSIGFGFGLSGDEDEDSTFNFGQPAAPSPFPKSDESENDGSDDDEKETEEIDTVPLVEDEDATFTFAYQTSEDSHGTSSTMHLPTLAPRSSSSTPSYSVPSTPSMPKFSDPATPRPRHKAKDSISVRRRHMEKASIDLNGASSLESVRRSTVSPSRTSEDSIVSSPHSEPTQFAPRSPPPASAKPQRFSMLVAPTLDISIPTSDFSSFLPSFEKLQSTILPPPPPPVMRPPITSSARSPPPIPPPSPARRSGSREMSLNNLKGKETVGTSSSSAAAPTHHVPRSSISLSLASLASLLPVSWSPRASPTSPTGSLGGRSSMERALVSREKQLNRLAERMGSQGSINSFTNGERSQSPLATATSQT